MSRDFSDLLRTQWGCGNFICVGLDPELSKIPACVQGTPTERIIRFNKALIDATADLVGAYKPNSAFYEAFGSEGMEALKETIAYAHEVAPAAVVILDAKRADIGNTNRGYVTAAFDWLQADAITVHPYLGRTALQPFLERNDKGVIVLCRTSNGGAGEFQDMTVGGKPLFQVVAEQVHESWNTAGNCALVVGATYPEEMKIVRACAPDVPFLIPGVGAQGGDVREAVRAGKDASDAGIIVSASRSIIYASAEDDFAHVAREKTQELSSAVRDALIA